LSNGTAVFNVDDAHRCVESLNNLTGPQILALEREHRFGLVKTFDIIADAGLGTSGWWEVWLLADTAVESAAKAKRRTRVWSALPKAKEVAAQAAVAEFLRPALNEGDFDKLTASWHDAIGR